MINEVSKYKLIDLFAGAGGLSNGFEQTGRFEVIGAVEINKAAINTYVYNHDNNENLIIKSNNNEISDITEINFKSFLKSKNLIGNETVVIGGPPCQGFSNANRQKNTLISGNNQLVKHYARAIDEIRPLSFLMENVKTMNSDKHKFFVTKHIKNTIYAYSSEEHLNEITSALNEKPFWKVEELTLIETNNFNIEPIIKLICDKKLQNPIFTIDKHLSRIRTIIRNLKKNKLYKVEKTKEKQEIEDLIRKITNYDLPENEFGEISIFKGIISNATETLNLLLKGTNSNNQDSLGKLEDLICINQLLRYLTELKNEHIVCIENPKIVQINSEKLKVVIKVKTYNIVQYLITFFQYLGYEVAPKVMIASEFYTPQNRARFMILGVKKDKIINGPVLMPEKVESEKLPFTVYDAIKDLEEIEPSIDVINNKLKYSQPRGMTRMQKYFRSNMDEDVVFNHINTASEPLSKQRFEVLKRTNGKNFHSLSNELKEISYTDGARTQNTVYLRLNYNEPSPTVINVRKSMWQHPEKPVALSIREAARLQSFKDDFVFKGSKDKQYQQVGNAVPPLLARAVAEQMLMIIDEEPVVKLSSEFNI